MTIFFLIPKYSKILSRADVDLSVKLSKGLSIQFPVMPANMKSISSLELFSVFNNVGAIQPLHRFDSIYQQIDFFLNLKSRTYLKNKIENYFAFSLGVQKEDYDNLSKLIHTGIKIFIIDIAHGDSKHCIDFVKSIF